MNDSNTETTLVFQRPSAPVEPVETPVVETGFNERYVLRDLLGRGAMGSVYRCLDMRIRREVAIKIADTMQEEPSDARQRFLREALVQGQLEHPVIAPLYEVGRDPKGAEFFTMKRVAGVTLETVLRARARQEPELTTKFSRDKLLSAFRRVCQGLEFAHAMGVIHRDLKPANIMLGEFGEVCILDWGLAKVISGDASRGAREPRTLAGQTFGTPGYAAPEQLISALAADARSDIYSLGAILFEIITLEPLHSALSDIERVRSTQIGVDESLSQRLKQYDAPPALEAICLRATALQPESRYPSVAALVDDLERILDADADEEHKRTLAVRHVEAAEEALAKVEASVNNEAERRRALEEVGRALALDPHLERPGRVLRRLLAAQPTRLPAEAEAALRQGQEEEARATTRLGAAMYGSFLMLGLIMLWAGVRSWVGVLLIAVPLGIAIGLCVYASRRREPPSAALLLTIFLASCAAILFASGLAGPLILVPALAGANVAATNRSMLRPYRGIMLLAGCASVVLPFAAQSVGLWSPSYDFSTGFFRVLPGVVALPELPVRVGLLLAGIITLLAPSLLVRRAYDATARAHERIHLQLSQLRRLIPEHVEVASRSGTRGAPAS